MAHFTYVRVGGVWNTLTTLTAAEMAAFDARVFKAVNGDDGGTWAPAARIIVGGLGVELASTTSGYHRVNGTGELRWESGTTLRGVIGSTMTWGGSATFTLATVFSNGFEANGTAQCNGGLEVTDAAPTNIDTDAGSVITINGDAQISCEGTSGHNASILGNSFAFWSTTGEIVGEGNTTFDPAGGKAFVLGSASADLRLEGAFVCAANTAGRVTKRVKVATDADFTIRADQYDIFLIPAGVLTGGHSLTISTTGALDGDIIRISSANTTYGVGVYPAGVYDVTVKNASTFYKHIAYVYMSGAWHQLDSALLP